jgi:Ca-activated chloride channel family protein
MRSFRLASRAWFGEAIADFLRRSHPSNEYFVLSFNTQVQLLQDYTKDHQRVLDIIANGPMTGLTALLNAIYSGLSKVEQKVGKKVLVLFTDGDENASALSTKELERAVGMSDVLIYPVLIGPLPQRESFMERPTLRPFAQLTGGTVSSCQQKSDCVKGLQELAAELRSQYRIGYVPLQPLDKQGWQKVAVKVPKKSDVGKLKARARQKYLAKP